MGHGVLQSRTITSTQTDPGQNWLGYLLSLQAEYKVPGISDFLLCTVIVSFFLFFFSVIVSDALTKYLRITTYRKTEPFATFFQKYVCRSLALLLYLKGNIPVEYGYGY
jgi:hypothetical protein